MVKVLIIKSLTIITGQGVRIIEVGLNSNISAIEDVSFSDNERHHWKYCIRNFNGDIVESIVNCPVNIKYYTPEELKNE